VRPGFYHKLQQAFEQKPEIGAAFCRQIFIDEQNHWQHITWLEQPESNILSNWLERIAVEQRIQTPSIVVRREVYEKLGGFDSRLSWCEDWEMWVRIAAQYPVWYEVEPLALYRIHSNSSSGHHIRTGENMRDVRRAIAIFQSYLPQTNAIHIVNQARENWALEAIGSAAPEMLARSDLAAASIQTKEALKCSRSLRVIRGSLLIFWRISKLWLKKPINKIIHKNANNS
jgi:hypothetical protein